VQAYPALWELWKSAAEPQAVKEQAQAREQQALRWLAEPEVRTTSQAMALALPLQAG